jgi:hypothetical protein
LPATSPTTTRTEPSPRAFQQGISGIEQNAGERIEREQDKEEAGISSAAPPGPEEHGQVS